VFEPEGMRPREILDTRFPDAVGGLVAGSTARGDDTPSSDLDLIVLLSGRPAPMRRTERVQGRLVEFFVHTEESFVAFIDRERRLCRSPLLHMCAHGLIICDHDGRLAWLRDLARDRWAAGPARLTDDELEDRRYRLTALLDDLADETNPADRAALAAAVFTDVADLALVSRGRWSGTGRWLTRRLREVDPDLSGNLVAGVRAAIHGDVSMLKNCGDAELERIGGPLDSGYERHA
jgi:predicted nucleotidyltransferase